MVAVVAEGAEAEAVEAETVEADVVVAAVATTGAESARTSAEEVVEASGDWRIDVAVVAAVESWSGTVAVAPFVFGDPAMAALDQRAGAFAIAAATDLCDSIESAPLTTASARLTRAPVGTPASSESSPDAVVAPASGAGSLTAVFVVTLDPDAAPGRLPVIVCGPMRTVPVDERVNGERSLATCAETEALPPEVEAAVGSASSRTGDGFVVVGPETVPGFDERAVAGDDSEPDVLVEADGLDDVESPSSAAAAPAVQVAIAAPIPNATANAPNRPIVTCWRAAVTNPRRASGGTGGTSGSMWVAEVAAGRSAPIFVERAIPTP